MRPDSADFPQQIYIFFTAGSCPSDDEVERPGLDELQCGLIAGRKHHVPLFRIQNGAKRPAHLRLGVNYERGTVGKRLRLWLSSLVHDACALRIYCSFVIRYLVLRAKIERATTFSERRMVWTLSFLTVFSSIPL